MRADLDAFLEHLRSERQVSAHTLDGYRLAYGREDLRNPSIIAAGHPAIDWKSLLPSD